MNKIRKNPLFIVGYPRSGTTLLMAMLGAHPDITLFNEPMLIKDMRKWKFGFKDYIGGQQKLELLEKLRKRHHVASKYDDLLATFAGTSEQLSFKEAYERLLPIPEGAKIWGEKTPSNLLYIEELLEMYPQALFIHITREPGAVLLSHYYKKIAKSKSDPVKCNNRTLEFFTLYSMSWAKRMCFAKQIEDRLEPSSIIRIKYEDLLNFPEKLMRVLCDRIGVRYDSSLLDEKSRQVSKILPAGTQYAHVLLGKPLDVSRSQAGKSNPGWLRYIINKYCEEIQKQMGYKVDRIRLSVFEKLFLDSVLALKGRKILRAIDQQLESLGVNTYRT